MRAVGDCSDLTFLTHRLTAYCLTANCQLPYRLTAYCLTANCQLPGCRLHPPQPLIKLPHISHEDIEFDLRNVAGVGKNDFLLFADDLNKVADFGADNVSVHKAKCLKSYMKFHS
jgi:hypothetical protein